MYPGFSKDPMSEIMINQLKSGVFIFDHQETYDALVEKHSGTHPWLLPQIVPVSIDMERFTAPEFNLGFQYSKHAIMLEHYKVWFQELVDIAELLQDPDTTWSCSN